MTAIDPEKQRELALRVVERLRDAGYESLWAGGCVRDKLLGRVPNDYDVATSATPKAICELFGKRNTLEIGAAFGVVAVVGRREEGLIEVATFRQDVQYSDGRRPDAVVFSTPEEDAKRRDFTINGLFYDPIADRVIDFVGGEVDLRLGVIRAIGDPHARFTEDKLRMVRAVRFGATFNFEIEPATLAAIGEMAATVHVVSAERIAQEMHKILVHRTRAWGLTLLAQCGLAGQLLAELDPPSPQSAIEANAAWQHRLRVLERLHEPGFPLTLAALVSAGGQAQRSAAPATTVAICRRWRLSNEHRNRAAWIVTHRGAIADAAAQPRSRLYRLLIQHGIADLLALEEAEAAITGGAIERQIADDVAYARGRLALPPEQLNPPRLISGNDLLSHGIPEGELYKELLDAVRDAQLDQQIATPAEALALVDRLLAEREWSRGWAIRIDGGDGRRRSFAAPRASAPASGLPRCDWLDSVGRSTYDQTSPVTFTIAQTRTNRTENNDVDNIDFVALAFRWLHILAAITAVGGTIFIRFTLVPAMDTLGEPERANFHEAVRSRWSRWVAAAILFLLLSGLYNFILINREFKLPPAYHAMFGIKFLLAMAIFALASILSGRSATAKKLRQNARFWLTLNLVMAVLVVCISGTMRTMHGTPRAELPPAAAPALEK